MNEENFLRKLRKAEKFETCTFFTKRKFKVQKRTLFGTVAKMDLPKPKAPSSLVKVSRWTMLGFGLFYGFSRNRVLSQKEAERRAKEEEERPAREAALKAEKDRKYREEMEYLGRETGVLPRGGSGGSGGDGGADCGCRF